jgi:arylsulfatase A-like enzyme
MPHSSFRLFVLALLLPAGPLFSAPSARPNVLVLVTDQQHARMMSCAGNPDVSTPAIDGLAAQGARFERAYTTNPVCIPARFSLMTGRMPSVIGMEHHREAGNFVAPEILASSLGHVFKGAGYRTVYAGKSHLPGQAGVIDNPGAYGFDEILAPEDKEGRDPAVDACVKFLQQPQDKPFVLYASLINPHDICFLAIREHLKRVGKGNLSQAMPALAELDRALEMPPGMSRDEFIEKMCPPLPANYAVPAAELSAPWADKPDFMLFARKEWGEREWRLHRWAYARLTERVDGQIGRILGALRAAGLDRNTVVVLTSDHGEQNGAHRVEHKAFLYEESTRIPFVVAWAGVTKPGLVDRAHLVSSGLDLLPTLCDFAGVAVPEGLGGRSVRPLAEGRPSAAWRGHLVIENTASRLVQTGRWKYMVGNARINPGALRAQGLPAAIVRESLVDLEADPGEMKNLAADPAARPALEQGRRLLKSWYEEHGLALDPAYLVTDAKK